LVLLIPYGIVSRSELSVGQHLVGLVDLLENVRGAGPRRTFLVLVRVPLQGQLSEVSFDLRVIGSHIEVEVGVVIVCLEVQALLAL